MADSTEMIQHQMEETRHRLAENLDKLGKQTVETVSEVASSVSETVEAVQETVQSVTGSVQETVEDVKGFFDLPGQVDRHPWLMVGGSVVVGYLAGSVLVPPSSGMSAPSASSMAGSTTYGDTAQSRPEYSGSYSSPSQGWGSQRSSSQGTSWLSSIAKALGPSLEQLKGLALGTTLGIARDVLTKGLEGELASQARSVIDDLTTNLGGKPINSESLSAFTGDSNTQKGNDHEHGNPTKMDRPVGTSHR
jgi:ElaB/YqjD/DUF883 family membrane-anchored ribosome-binding protein